MQQTPPFYGHYFEVLIVPAVERFYCMYELKCEFDADVKIEQKVIITMMENNQGFIKKVHIKTQSKTVLVVFTLQETKNSNLFDKN